MVKRNRHRAGQRKRAKIKKKRILDNCQNSVGDFHLQRGQLEKAYKETLIRENPSSSTIPEMILTEDDPSSFTSLNFEFPSPSYSPTLTDSPQLLLFLLHPF